MRKGVAITIPVVIGVAIVLAIVLGSNQKPDSMEVEDTLNKEVIPEESPEVQKKIEEIEKTKSENQYSPKEREWLTSGPFQIDRSKYAIGEKVFLVIGGLNANEKGQVAFLRPLNATHYSTYMTIPFDGAAKPAFNYYINPQISKVRGICSVDDIAGKWTVVFRGTDYPNLNFEITKDVVPGTNTTSVC